jgi:hypothetical protein
MRIYSFHSTSKHAETLSFTTAKNQFGKASSKKTNLRTAEGI